MIAIFLSLGQSMPAQPGDPAPQYVTNASDVDSDCNGAHALLGGHCCASVACSAYAQIDATSTTSADISGRLHLPVAQGVHISRSPRPNPQPPKHSSQA
jgi:hypothetical protein